MFSTGDGWSEPATVLSASNASMMIGGWLTTVPGAAVTATLTETLLVLTPSPKVAFFGVKLNPSVDGAPRKWSVSGAFPVLTTTNSKEAVPEVPTEAEVAPDSRRLAVVANRLTS